MTTPISTRDHLLPLLAEAEACRMRAAIEPLTKLIETLGDRPLLELSAWDVAAPLAELGYDVDEYRAHVRDWEPSYAEGAAAPWAHEDDERLPHPIVVEAAEAGFGRGRVLELGCGVGSNSAALAERGAAVLGVDISARAIARAGELFASHAGELEFRAANVFELELEPQSFDAILDSWCMHHIPGHLLGNYVQRGAAALRAGGELLVLVHSAKYNPTLGLVSLSLGVVGKFLRYVLQHNPESCFTRSELERLLDPVYEIEWIRHYYDFHINTPRHYSFIVRARRR
ncbi:class I SAM-dependent methyltransferase [Enhygromyxa salina]|uniref:Methyltransferase domain-containing protein n=1 Tax=Enhygromyxa salina TaxID=215803 RepID=A0A2S9YPD6_9BACT|nr:class I SAM-dependent methyltransferase [Enhygromyxa salina]PRQ06953.1 hypothetical protein ENSA7_33770 [Enhygromyxa salina]